MQTMIVRLCQSAILLLLFSGWIHGSLTVRTATLSSPTGLADGTDHALLSVSTDTGSGNLFYIISTNCSAATAAQIIAGHDAGNIAPSPGTAGSQAVLASGAQSLNPSGMTGVNTYCAQFAQVTGADSNAVITSSFKTAGSLTITPTFDSTWTSATNHVAMTAAANDAISFLENCLTPAQDMNVAITFKWSAISGLGQSATNVILGNDYASLLRPALQSLQNQNSQQRTAFAALPGTSPTGNSSFSLYYDQMQALGISCVGPSCNDSNNAVTMSSSAAWDFTAGNGACTNAGAFCFESTLFHEITEVLGRLDPLDFSDQGTYELFTYSAPGTRNFTSPIGSIRYTSFDGGSHSVMPPLHGAAFTANSNGWNTSGSGDHGDEGAINFTTNSPFLNASPAGNISWGASESQVIGLTIGFTLSHSCRLSAGL